MRIGDLAARTGVSPSTLRAWERRYGVPRPARTEGSHRVYDHEDVARVRAVVALVQSGLRVSEAVRRLSAPPADVAPVADEARRRLWAAIDAFEEETAAAELSTVTATLGIPPALDEVVVPILRLLGKEWRLSPRNVAREHFTSTLVRSHLVRLLSAGHTSGASCLAFCPEGEHHDIGLLMASLTVATTGTPQIVVGANTPAASIDMLLRELRPRLVLVAAATRRPVARFLATWQPPAGALVLAGGGGFRPADEPSLGGRVHHGPYGSLPALLTRSPSGLGRLRRGPLGVEDDVAE